MRKLLPSLVLGSGLLIYVAACSDDSSPTQPSGVCSGPTFSVDALQGRVIAAADVPCLTIPADGSTYLVVPQFATDSAPVKAVSFTLAATAGTATASVVVASGRTIRSKGAAHAELGRAQREFEGALRRQERLAAFRARGGASGRGPLASRVLASVTPPPIGSTRPFQVLSNLSGSAFKTDTATLKYVGSHLLIYQSKNAPGPADGTHGFTDAQITAFGNTFDQDLYSIDVSTFGAPSDIDGNGRVIVLLSPIVNSLVTASECHSTSYIAGFFDATDLVAAAHSNDAEIFYALVPDPSGTFSCAHSVQSVDDITPPTFIHEFQHMISFGQHFIIHGGQDEDQWLNEGLSHIAEELGSRYYEDRFPPPLDRMNPTQLFPDSAQGFINGDLYNSYHFLLDPTNTDDSTSVSDWANDGTLAQRGGAWLFLRWLGDQQNSTVYGRLDQTSLTGATNVAAAAATPFATLFGEFALALYTDSLPGVSRSSIPSQFRFSSRNLRALYGHLHEFSNANGSFPFSFPIDARPLVAGSQVHDSMFPGTMDFFVITAPSSGAPPKLTFAPTGGSTFKNSLNAQVSVFHCPSAAACPLSVQ